MSGKQSSGDSENQFDKSNKTSNLMKKFLEKEIEEMELKLAQRLRNLERLRAMRWELNNKVNALREEIEEIENSSSKLVGTCVRKVDYDLALIKIGKINRILVPASESIDLDDLKPNDRVAICTQEEVITNILPVNQNHRVKSMMLEHLPDVTYDMIGGLDKQIQEVKECIEIPLKHPELFQRLGVQQPKGVLLYGPPGTGKTMLARAIAHHTKCTFIRTSGTEFVQKYIGEGAELIRDLFRMAKDHAPSIIFLDEVDSIGGKRGRKHNSEVERTMLELLSHLDGFDPADNVKIIMATNRIQDLDPALLRSGRIDRKIEFGSVANEKLAHVFAIHSKNMNLSRDIDFDIMFRNRGTFTGAEIKAVCTEAGMFAIRNKRNYANREDFEAAIEKIATKSKAFNSTTTSLDKMWK